MLSVEELKKRIPIQEENLVSEVMRQPVLFDEAATHLKEAREKADQAKNDMEKTLCEISLKIREKCNIENVKVTEKYIDSLVTTTPDYLKSVDTYFHWKSEADDRFLLVEAYRMRASMLKALVHLQQSISPNREFSPYTGE